MLITENKLPCYISPSLHAVLLSTSATWTYVCFVSFLLLFFVSTARSACLSLYRASYPPSDHLRRSLCIDWCSCDGGNCPMLKESLQNLVIRQKQVTSLKGKVSLTTKDVNWFLHFQVDDFSSCSSLNSLFPQSLRCCRILPTYWSIDPLLVAVVAMTHVDHQNLANIIHTTLVSSNLASFA